MPRTRNIKPGFFKNEDLAECEPLARILFAGLWTIADRDGRLEDRPKRIKAELLPYDQADADLLLEQLAGQSFIIRYSVAGEDYIQIPTWGKNQHPHVNELPSIIPSPDDVPSNNEESYTSTVQVPDSSGANTPLTASSNLESLKPHPESLNQDDQDAGAGRRGREARKSISKQPPPDSEAGKEIVLMSHLEEASARLLNRPLTRSHKKYLNGWFQGYKRQLTEELIDYAEGETAGHTDGESLSYMLRVIENRLSGKSKPAKTSNGNGRSHPQEIDRNKFVAGGQYASLTNTPVGRVIKRIGGS